MDKEKFVELCDKVPSATRKVGQPTPGPYPFYPPTPFQTFSSHISSTYNSNVNAFTEVKPSDFAAHKFLHERSISGRNYFKRSKATYNRKLRQGWSGEYFAKLERETWRRNRTNYNLTHNCYWYLTSCSHKWQTSFIAPNHYNYLVKLRDYSKKKQTASNDILVEENLKHEWINRNYSCNSNLEHIIERNNRNYCSICARGLGVGGL